MRTSSATASMRMRSPFYLPTRPFLVALDSQARANQRRSTHALEEEIAAARRCAARARILVTTPPILGRIPLWRHGRRASARGGTRSAALGRRGRGSSLALGAWRARRRIGRIGRLVEDPLILFVQPMPLLFAVRVDDAVLRHRHHQLRVDPARVIVLDDARVPFLRATHPTGTCA